MPKVLQLPAGKGVSFANDMDDLINSLRKALPKIFESKEYKKRSKEVLADIEKHINNLYERLEEKFSKAGFAMVDVQTGSLSVPELRPVVKDKEIPFDKLESSVAKGEISKEELKKIKENHEILVDEMENAAREARKMEREMRNAVSDLKRQFCSPVVKDLINELKERYPNEAVGKYLDDVEDNILQNLERFKGEEEKEHQVFMPVMQIPKADEFLEFKVNVVVDNSKLERLPVITETAPNYKNLFGTIGRIMDTAGIWRTDFTKIKAGSLLKANGGYLDRTRGLGCFKAYFEESKIGHSII
jgi:predicted ATP-dependent protease